MNITFPNGIYFTKSSKKLVDSQSIGTYKVKSKGILFFNKSGEPFCYLCANDEYSPFFVSCGYNGVNDKRIRYSFSISSVDEKTLGIDQMRHIEQRDFELNLWNKFKKAELAV